jgi:hypothetical protein
MTKRRPSPDEIAHAVAMFSKYLEDGRDLDGVVAVMRDLRLVDDRLGVMPGFDDRRTTPVEQQRLAAFLRAYRDD